MLGRIRGAALALGLIVASAGALAQEQIEAAPEGQPEPSGGQQEGGQASQQEPTPEQGRAPDLLPAIQSIESAIRDLIPQEDQRERQWQEYREKADLQAQESMALWAFWMTVASLASVGLTAAGVLLIWRTLIHTRRAAEAAAASVDEAREIAAITRDLGVRQIRAYVTVSSIDLQNFESGKEPRAIIGILNTGQSPAMGLRVLSCVNMNVPDKALRVAFTTPKHLLSVATLNAGPLPLKITLPFRIILNNESIPNVMNGKRTVAVSCYIFYRDVFLKKRRTIAKMVLDITAFRHGEIAFRPHYKGNRAT